VETVDIDPDLKPDHIASAKKLRFDDNSYDCVCAFQMLERLPYDQSIQAFAEMTKLTRKNLVISLPDAKGMWVYSFCIPKYGQKILLIPVPGFVPFTTVLIRAIVGRQTSKTFIFRRSLMIFLCTQKSSNLTGLMNTHTTGF